ncbi:uncharacterized protein LOC144545201 [Carex rostrata]
MLCSSLTQLLLCRVHTLSDSNKRRRRNCKWKWRIQSSSEEEDAEIEIDQKKAREALKRLDQQLQTLSQPQPLSPSPPTPPKPSPLPDSESDFFMRRDAREEMPEISDSYLLYAAGALVMLTIFYNVIFSFYIKPSIDGYQKPIILERVPLSEPQ